MNTPASFPAVVWAHDANAKIKDAPEARRIVEVKKGVFVLEVQWTPDSMGAPCWSVDPNANPVLQILVDALGGLVG